MRHAMAIFIKLFMITIILLIVLGMFYGVHFTTVLMISLILTAASYLLGDLFILPKFGNMSATIADFILALVGVWALGSLFIGMPIHLGTASFISAILITAGEYFFHFVMKTQILGEDIDISKDPSQPDFQVEFSQDFGDPINREKDRDLD